MKVTVKEDLGIQLEEVFNHLTLKTESGEKMSICMRDSGFEFKYQGEWYSAKEGLIEPFPKPISGSLPTDEHLKFAEWCVSNGVTTFYNEDDGERFIDNDKELFFDISQIYEKFKSQ